MASPACHVVVETQPGPGDWHMLLDEALLMAGVERSQCAVRVYRWSVPTISLGYFQKVHELGQAFPAGTQLPVVRRLTGGGALLHHHEWTYACVVPASHALSREPLRMYEIVHQAIMDLLTEQHVACQFAGSTGADVPTDFLCHTRRDRFDVTCQGHKILGSAQRRRRGSVLQHGSLLIRASAWAPKFLGIGDLNEGICCGSGWGHELGVRIAGGLGSPQVLAQHDARDLARVTELRNVSVGKFR